MRSVGRVRRTDTDHGNDFENQTGTHNREWTADLRELARCRSGNQCADHDEGCGHASLKRCVPQAILQVDRQGQDHAEFTEHDAQADEVAPGEGSNFEQREVKGDHLILGGPAGFNANKQEEG